MPTFSRGDVLLAQFPFTDLTGTSVRPCLVVSPGLIGQDPIVTGISSVVRGGAIATDVVVEDFHREFAQAGLRVRSVIRLHKLACVEQSLLFGMTVLLSTRFDTLRSATSW